MENSKKKDAKSLFVYAYLVGFSTRMTAAAPTLLSFTFLRFMLQYLSFLRFISLAMLAKRCGQTSCSPSTDGGCFFCLKASLKDLVLKHGALYL